MKIVKAQNVSLKTGDAFFSVGAAHEAGHLVEQAVSADPGVQQGISPAKARKQPLLQWFDPAIHGCDAVTEGDDQLAALLGFHLHPIQRDDSVIKVILLLIALLFHFRQSFVCSMISGVSHSLLQGHVAVLRLGGIEKPDLQRLACRNRQRDRIGEGMSARWDREGSLPAAGNGNRLPLDPNRDRADDIGLLSVDVGKAKTDPLTGNRRADREHHGFLLPLQHAHRKRGRCRLTPDCRPIHVFNSSLCLR